MKSLNQDFFRHYRREHTAHKMVTWLFFLCILLPLMARFLPPLCLHLWMRLKGKANEAADLKLEIEDLKQQQSEISMMDEFAKHAKLGRKVTAKTNTLKEIQSNQLWIRMKAFWYSKIALYAISAITFFVFKYEPVLFFDISKFADEYTAIYVTAYIIAFPSGIIGAVGMPVALFVCNRLVNQILNLVTPDKSKAAMVHEPVE